MAKSIYLDSTIPSYYYDERPEISTFVSITRTWWHEESRAFDIFVSEYTVAEVSRGAHPHKEAILSLVRGIPLLPKDDLIDEIARVYMKEYVMPKGAAGDAFHLACASLNKIDYLLNLELQSLGKREQGTSHQRHKREAGALYSQDHHTVSALSRKGGRITTPHTDPIVSEKHRVQMEMLEEAGGDFKEYSRIVHREALAVREDSTKLETACSAPEIP